MRILFGLLLATVTVTAGYDVAVPLPYGSAVPCTVQSIGAYADKDAKLTLRCNTNGEPLMAKNDAITIDGQWWRWGRPKAGGGTTTTGGGTGDPTTLPLLHEANFTYNGGFRMPYGNFTGGSDNFTGSNGAEASGGRFMAFDPSDGQIYIMCYGGKVAKISVPTLSTSATISDYTPATVTQNCYDLSEGHIAADVVGSTAQGFMLDSDNNKLVQTQTILFDSGGTQTISHFTHSKVLATSSWSGWSELRSGSIISRYFSGYMAPIPAVWQTLLGGKALTGNCCHSIISMTSNGMSLASFDPGQVSVVAQPTITPLVYYTVEEDKDTLGTWLGQTELYGAVTDVNGVAIIEGTRTAVFFGRNGLNFCYGIATNDPVDVPVNHCYDPWSTDGAGHGQHAYPYYYQFWLVDLNDLVAVKNGTKQPWEVVPYEYFDVTFQAGIGGTPPPGGTSQYGASYAGGMAYDAAHQYLYVGQAGVDSANGFIALAPIIHRFTITVP